MNRQSTLVFHLIALRSPCHCRYFFFLARRFASVLPALRSPDHSKHTNSAGMQPRWLSGRRLTSKCKLNQQLCSPGSTQTRCLCRAQNLLRIDLGKARSYLHDRASDSWPPGVCTALARTIGFRLDRPETNTYGATCRSVMTMDWTMAQKSLRAIPDMAGHEHGYLIALSAKTQLSMTGVQI